LAATLRVVTGSQPNASVDDATALGTDNLHDCLPSRRMSVVGTLSLRDDLQVTAIELLGLLWRLEDAGVIKPTATIVEAAGDLGDS